MLWFQKKKKGPPGHQTNFQKSIDQNQSFFSWPKFEHYDMKGERFLNATVIYIS